MEAPSGAKTASIVARMPRSVQTLLSNAAGPLTWLLLGRFGRPDPVSWKACFLATLAIALIGIGLPFDHFSAAQRRAVTDGIVGHASLSLIIAVDRSLCGTVSSTTPDYNFNQKFGSLGVNIFTTPVLELPAIAYGSAESYCEQVSKPWINNENSLMFLFDAVFRIAPKTSLQGLTYWMDAVRYFCLSVFAFSLIRFGCGLFFSFLVFVAGSMITLLSAPPQLLSMYPLLMPVTAAFVGILLLGYSVRPERKWRVALGVGLVIGLAGAFLFNLRTSHLPLIVFGSALFLVMIVLRREEASGRLWKMRLMHATLMLAAICGGFALFQQSLVAPIGRQPASKNENFHVIFHPLVLSLAFPEGNPLAKREGIQWSDLVGLDLARRIDPNVVYLGPTYEKALAAYYAKLWIFYPDEMEAIYKAKLKLAGKSTMAYLSAPTTPSLFRIAVWPLRKTPSGGDMILICILVLGACIGLCMRTRSRNFVIIFFISIICIMDVLLVLEKTIILPVFTFTHQQTSLFFTVLSGLLIEQGALIAAVYLVRQVVMRMRGLEEG